MCFHVFVKGPVGQRFHSGGNLQHTIESYHWPESSVKSEHKLVEIPLQVCWASFVVCSQKPRVQVSEHNVDHREMLITSDWHGCVLVSQIVQIVVASPPVGPHFRVHLYVSQYHRFQRFLLAGSG